jgi:hypothetical protein
VGQRVADVGGDRLDAVLGDDGGEQLVAAPEGLVPAHLAPGLAVAHQGSSQAVGIVVEVADGRALGAQVAPAPGVVAVGPDELDLVAGHVDLQPAHRLAQRAGAQVDLAGARARHRRRRHRDPLFGRQLLTLDKQPPARGRSGGRATASPR